ncbi:MAG TPA: hypothetical protein VFI96_00925 [Longimicrobiaceae bacterium]|nr:hypothetical protein [Longimicrobiaceae bacterium]
MQDDLLIACPFIRATEADWVCNQLLARGLGTSVRVQILTDIRADTVLRGALEIGALSMFAEAFANTVLINLPRVHAKVYVADNNFALVTSARAV